MNQELKEYTLKYNHRCALVLGSHRSGTSVLTRSLLAVGVFLGDSLYGSRYDNPKGFFEDRTANQLDDGFLNCIARRWDSLLLPDPIEYEVIAAYQKNLKENAMKNQRDLFKNIVKNKLNEKKNEDMEKETDEDEDEKTPSSKKTINISYEPENYKKNRAKSLDNLIAMLMKKEPVNEDNGAIDLDVDDDISPGSRGGSDEEEERKKLLKKIANSLGTGENVAGINPFESNLISSIIIINPSSLSYRYTLQS
jgi:hypothetical protein